MSLPKSTAGVLMFIVSGLFVTAARSQPFVDDFEDGSVTDGKPVSWVPYIAPWGQEQTVEIVDGDLLLTPSPTAQVPPVPGFASDYIEADLLADGRLLQDVSVHTVARVSGEGQGWVTMTVRDTWNDDPLAMGVSVWAAVGIDMDGNRLVRFGGSTGSNLQQIQRATTLDIHETDVHLQLDVFGNQASFFAWEDGEDKPATPLFSRTVASTQMVAGQVGIGYGQARPSVHPLNQLNTAEFRFVQVVPEPSSAFLAGFALLGLVIWRRQRSA